MKEIIKTLRYFSRDGRSAKWIRFNLVASLVVIVSALIWVYSASYLSLTESNIEKYQTYINGRIAQSRAEENYKRDGGKVVRILDAMQQNFSQPAMVQKIEELALTSGVTVSSQKYRAAGNKNSSWQIDIHAQGKYAGLKSFMKKLSRLRGVAVFEKVKLSQTETTEHLALQIQILIFKI